MTPQGQQVVVTQVPRPILQQSSVTNNIVPVSTVVKSTPAPVATQTTATPSNSVQPSATEKKPEEPKPVAKPKIVRDLTTPFVCEWGDCQV